MITILICLFVCLSVCARVSGVWWRGLYCYAVRTPRYQQMAGDLRARTADCRFVAADPPTLFLSDVVLLQICTETLWTIIVSIYRGNNTLFVESRVLPSRQRVVT